MEPSILVLCTLYMPNSWPCLVDMEP
jgi:hypothetical protein